MDEINWNDVIFENDKKNRSNERFFSYLIYFLTKRLFRKSSPDSCVKCYTMFLPFLLIKIDVFS